MGKIVVCAPSRIYEDYPGGKFSYTAMVDYFEKVGIGAIDMSFESLSRLDDSKNAVLYAAAKRARAKNIKLPVCHLSFYMPDPKRSELMAKYSLELRSNIDMAALMGIPLAVIHPIAWYSSEVKYGDWVRANMAFLSPLVEYARAKGVRLCIENMPSEREAEGNHLYGSCALNISSLAEKLGIGICWDVGHANISGYKQSEQMQILKGKIDVLHVHDNGGKGAKDAHLLPFDGSVDWEDVAFGMRCSGFEGILDVEVTAWALPGDEKTRRELGGSILSRAKRLISMSEQATV
jgi:sugar phosphate isomerase/epimerase